MKETLVTTTREGMFVGKDQREEKKGTKMKENIKPRYLKCEEPKWLSVKKETHDTKKDETEMNMYKKGKPGKTEGK